MNRLLQNLPRLGRPTDHRMSMLKTMVTQLIEHERISTTLAKASALRRIADKVIGLAKDGTQQAWDKARGVIKTDRELHKLFTTMAMRYKDREGGYTRVVKTGFRERDAAPTAFIEFVDRPGELRPASPPRQKTPYIPLPASLYIKQHRSGE